MKQEKYLNEKRVKEKFSVSLSHAQKQRILDKAAEAGFSGTGMFSQFIQKVADEDIVFADTNTKILIGMFARDNGKK